MGTNHNNYNRIKQIIFTLLFSGIFLWQVSAADQVQQAGLRRFAIVIGSNNGGAERVMLRYATKDALSFSKVMKEMGAVSADDIIVLLDPDTGKVFAAFRKIRDKVALYEGSEAGKTGSGKTPGRTELMVYYSGHSDEEGILLNGERLGYKQLRDEISGVNTDVRVAILDSCSSGAFTRTKGVIKQPPFLIDSSSAMEGYAFLTSSSDDEAAQESDSIGASFFTHYLVSGLRGAADSTADGMVTLNEAYSYAFRETLARTEKTQYGPQHPEYDIQLTGTGDLVLTDLRETSASLLLADELDGTFFIRDTSGNLVVELRKTAGHIIEVGLEPGKYLIILDKNGELFRGSIQLKKNDRKPLALNQFDKIKDEKTTARGDEDDTTDDDTTDVDDDTVIIPFNFSLLPSFTSGGFLNYNYSYTVSLNLLIGTAANINGCQISLIGNLVNYDATGCVLSAIFNSVSGNMTGYQAGSVGNFLGGDLLGVQNAGVFNYVAGDAGVVQNAGIINITKGNLVGLQTSGCINLLNKSMTGAQVAGISNVTGGNAIGAQISGISNYALSITGAQIAGLLNISGDCTGVQLGVVNIAQDVTGVQLGVVNIARNYKNGIPVGLVNIVEDGYYCVDVWQSFSIGDSLSDTIPGSTNLGFRFGTKWMYTLLTCGFDPDSSIAPLSSGAGFGMHIPISSVCIDADASLNTIFPRDTSDSLAHLPRIRTLCGISIGEHLIISAGCTFNLGIPGGSFFYNLNNAPWEIPLPFAADPLCITPEPFAGISFRF